LDYTGLGPPQVLPSDAILAVWRLTRRVLVLSSAVIIALVISGGIFIFTPLIGLRIAHTSGVSMEPAYKQGDLVLIRDAGPGDFEVGDIVVFEALDMEVMHRVIEERTGPDGEPMIVTQGDNVARPDIPINASQVNGKLVGEVPVLGTLSRLIDADGGFYVYRSIILTLAVTTVAVWAMAISVRRRQEQLDAAAAPGTAGEPPLDSPQEPD
jgi:signal peptidase I